VYQTSYVQPTNLVCNIILTNLISVYINNVDLIRQTCKWWHMAKTRTSLSREEELAANRERWRYARCLSPTLLAFCAWRAMAAWQNFVIAARRRLAAVLLDDSKRRAMPCAGGITNKNKRGETLVSGRGAGMVKRSANMVFCHRGVILSW